MTKGETKRCVICETLFFPLRNDALYCSARCRKRAARGQVNRAKNEKQSYYMQTLAGVRKLQSEGAFNQLRLIVISAIEGMGDDHRKKLYDSISTDFYRLK